MSYPGPHVTDNMNVIFDSRYRLPFLYRISCWEIVDPFGSTTWFSFTKKKVLEKKNVGSD
jgi:hypothetical protein